MLSKKKRQKIKLKNKQQRIINVCTRKSTKRNFFGKLAATFILCANQLTIHISNELQLTMKNTILFLALCALILSACNQNEKIGYADLLEEMAERSSLTYYPKTDFKCRQFSSYSHDSETKETAEEDGLFKPESGRDWGKGWFENHDFGNFIRTEENEGRKENVMLEDNGPGVILALWHLFNEGKIRIYIDDNPQPVIEIDPNEFAGSNKFISKPFSFHAPEKAENDNWRGRNFILPISYARKCKITYTEGKSYPYYHVIYRSYKPGTIVESFTKNTIIQYKNEIEQCGKKLMSFSSPEGDRHSKNGITLKPGESHTLTALGKRAIISIKTKLAAQNQEQALRSTVLTLNFDGKQTFWCPVGQFYGVGYKQKSHQSYYIKADEKGNMVSRWVMPFKKKAEITLTNYGEQDVYLEEFELVSKRYKWKKNSMYFHGTWKETRNMETAFRFDYNYSTIKGKGIFVGDNLTIFNSFPDSTGINWWGEGDEKIYVDGETFPSHFGTGTEDYYCYAYCRPQPFSSPIATQPCGEGNKTPGHTSNNRYRLLDIIPFNTSLSMDMEIWHPYRAKMNYSPATFFYALPGAECNVEPDPEGVRQKVALKVGDVN